MSASFSNCESCWRSWWPKPWPSCATSGERFSLRCCKPPRFHMVLLWRFHLISVNTCMNLQLVVVIHTLNDARYWWIKLDYYVIPPFHLGGFVNPFWTSNLACLRLVSCVLVLDICRGLRVGFLVGYVNFLQGCTHYCLHVKWCLIFKPWWCSSCDFLLVLLALSLDSNLVLVFVVLIHGYHPSLIKRTPNKRINLACTITIKKKLSLFCNLYAVLLIA